MLRHIICSVAMLAMASAQTTLPTTINADSTSAVQTSYTLTGTSIAAATGSPPPVASTTILVASTAATSIPISSSTSTASSLSVPEIAGIAAAGAFLLIAGLIILTVLCIRHRRNPAAKWPELTDETLQHLADIPTPPRRPSSAATLVDAPQAYTHSKGLIEYPPDGLRYSKSSKSMKSTRSTILERVSEEAADEFKFDFGVPPNIEITPPPEQVQSHVAQMNDYTLQKLSLDKSLPSSPEHEIPMRMLDLENYQEMAQVEDGRTRSSFYSTATGQAQRDTWEGNPVEERQSYF